VLANQHRSRRRLENLRSRLAREHADRWPHLPATGPDEAAVDAALARLGARDREALLLAERQDLTPTEIAGVLGCLVVTARGRLHRARRRFRDQFEAVTDPEPAAEPPLYRPTRTREVHT
jgi:RNA polymerase sigma-70 factor (ECF subfamily)